MALTDYPYCVKISEEHDDIDEWIVDNIEGMWIADVDESYYPTGIYCFENEHEAVLFALKWS